MAAITQYQKEAIAWEYYVEHLTTAEIAQRYKRTRSSINLYLQELRGAFRDAIIADYWQNEDRRCQQALSDGIEKNHICNKVQQGGRMKNQILHALRHYRDNHAELIAIQAQLHEGETVDAVQSAAKFPYSKHTKDGNGG